LSAMRQTFVIDIYTAGSEQPVDVDEVVIQQAIMSKYTDYFVDVKMAEVHG
jgi:hypothetical protein